MEHCETATVAAIPQPFPIRLNPTMLQASLLRTYPDLPIINISPGELLFTKEPAIVSTILGSCVSLCLHSKKFRVGAICHCILPRQTKPPAAGQFPYLDTAVPHMLKTMATRFGIAPTELTVKLFGGASVLQTAASGTDGISIGQQNITAALEALALFDLTPCVQKTGGATGYKIFFNTSTGEIFVRRIAPAIAKNFAQAKKKNGVQ